MEQLELEPAQRLPFSIWSATHYGVVRDLVRVNGSLNVMLYPDFGDAAGPTAVAVVWDRQRTSHALGNMFSYSYKIGGREKDVGQLIGHVARGEPSEDRSWQYLAGDPKPAVLIEDSLVLMIEIPPVIDDGIPF